MKKIFVFCILAILFVIGVAACGTPAPTESVSLAKDQQVTLKSIADDSPFVDVIVESKSDGIVTVINTGVENPNIDLKQASYPVAGGLTIKWDQENNIAIIVYDPKMWEEVKP